MDRRWTGLVGVGLLLAVGAAAQEPAGAADTNATVIRARRLEFDYARRTAVFEGDVVVTDPQVRIESDTLTVVFSAENEPETLTAAGNVRIQQTERRATCERAVYTVRSGLLVLTGEPRMMRGNESIAGTRIVFRRDEDKLTVDNARVQLVPGQRSGGWQDVVKPR